MNKKEKIAKDYISNWKEELTHQAFWLFASAYRDRKGVDLLNFQKKIRSKVLPNRQTPHNEETRKLQNTQNKRIDRIVKSSLPKLFPSIEIVTNPKFRSFIRFKHYNYKHALERKSHKDFLNSDLIKTSGVTTSSIAKNIKANKHLIKKYNLSDARIKDDGITPNFSAKNIQKWKEGKVRIPAPLLLLVMCSLHKWIEANKEKLSRGRPRKIKDVNTHEIAQLIQGVSKIMELGDFPLFNSQMIFTLFENLSWINDIDEAIFYGLSKEETADAIWNLYGKELSYNPITNKEDHFTKDHLSIEIINKQHANEKLKLRKKMMGIPDDVDILEFANILLETKGMDIKAAPVNRAKIYGDLLNTNYDHVENILKIYNKIYSEFRLVESTRPYEKTTVEEPKKNDQIHWQIDSLKKTLEKIDRGEAGFGEFGFYTRENIEEQIRKIETKEYEENKFENPEDYHGI
tara:strand:- start:3187 stop:4566 length:1380 start_codon:yes stop_codon:yes gene_type:complete